MVQTCSACKTRQSDKSIKPISFFKFPDDPDLRKMWLIAINRENYKPSSHARVCSKHFSPDSYNTSGWSTKRVLKKDAVPSVTDFSEQSINQYDTEIVTRVSEYDDSRDPLVSTDQNNDMPMDSVEEPPMNKQPETYIDESSRVSDIKLEYESDSVDNFDDSEDPLSLIHQTSDMRMDSQQPKKKQRRTYIGDFNHISDINLEYKCVVQKVIAEKDHQIRLLKQRIRRSVKNITTFESLMCHLKEKLFINDDLILQLSNCLTTSSKNILQENLTSKQKKEYSPELRAFALTLNFYCPNAYNYIRRTFKNVLPHPKILRKWYTVECNAGFQTECINVLRSKVSQMKAKGKICFVSLMIGEMEIRRKIEWNGNRFVGCMDIGVENDVTDQMPEAKQAIVFMINSLHERWKIPLGYFLIDGLYGEQKVNLINLCINILYNIGVVVCSVIFDGTISNISAMRQLGVNFYADVSCTSFDHPVSEEPIFFIMNPPHMLKLIRNTFGTYKTIYDAEGNAIKWDYLVKLVEVQIKEKFYLVHKLTRRHIDWMREPMNVKLAIQTLSLSCAKSLQYLRSSSYSEDFRYSEATEVFLTTINDAFGILNARKLIHPDFKARVQGSNYPYIRDRVEKIINYLKQLKCDSGQLLINCRQNVGFVGMIFSLRSLLEIFNHYSGYNTSGGLKFSLRYKICQDHLEMFFNAIRKMTGYNDNPTVIQFQTAYKKLLLHTDVSSSNNVNNMEPTLSTNFALSTNRKIIVFEKLAETENSFPLQNDHNYAFNSVTYSTQLSLYVSNAVEYVACSVIEKVRQSVKCEICMELLVDNTITLNWINIKNYSNKKSSAINPSRDVIKICKTAEAEIRITENTPSLYRVNLLQLIVNVFNSVRDDVFSNILLLKNDVEVDHLINLIKLISYYYINLRLNLKPDINYLNYSL